MCDEILTTDVCLEVVNMDLAFNSAHFYAKLHPQGGWGGTPVTLTRELSKRDAGILNKRHGCKTGAIGAYKEGETYEGFDSVQQALDKALEQWKTHFPEAKRLVWARPYWADHEGVLDTNP